MRFRHSPGLQRQSRTDFFNACGECSPVPWQSDEERRCRRCDCGRSWKCIQNELSCRRWHPRDLRAKAAASSGSESKLGATSPRGRPHEQGLSEGWCRDSDRLDLSDRHRPPMNRPRRGYPVGTDRESIALVQGFRWNLGRGGGETLKLTAVVKGDGTYWIVWSNDGPGGTIPAVHAVWRNR